jgi:hypothetical protein
MIVIPMAGMSSRFTAAGYDRPKYMLPLAGKTVFDHAVGSFEAYFASVPFLFIARGGSDVEKFVIDSCAALGIQRARVVMIEAATAGQAETVEIGLRAAAVDDGTSVTIFNIDTFRPGFKFPSEEWLEKSAGYLEVFKGAGSNWSYVRPAAESSPRVLETAEKQPISNLCCTGLYHFERAEDYLMSLELERKRPSTNELYVAPLYNHLIRAGRAIHYRVVAVSEIVFCGVPSEYEALLAFVHRVGAASRNFVTE